MMNYGKLTGIVVSMLLLGTVGMSAESSNMIGHQSQNEGVQALPVPGKVTIDGDLSDWDWSGRIEVFAEHALRGRYSVEMAAMWDEENLYLGAKWCDPTPMYSQVNPHVNPDKGWVADAWQLRIKTDKTIHITDWYYVQEKRPCVSVSYAKDGRSPKALKSNSPGVFENGIQLAYRKGADGKSFSQEMAIPWRFLYKKLPEVKAGLTFRMGNEFLWGDVTGRTWPMHRYADNMQPGVTSREFYWSNWKAWGDMTLVAKGKVKSRTYAIQENRPVGTIPVRMTIPTSAVRFTLAIDDAKGQRIRNLAGDFPAQDYRIAQDAKGQVVEVMWDGKDDDGKLVLPGAYTIRALTHTGIGAEYEMCYYNPGKPPWGTPNGNGAWGGDHNRPCGVAAAGDWMIVSWPGAEGGSGIIGVGPDMLKKWGEKRGAALLAANSKYLYGYLPGHGSAPRICRYAVKDGAYKAFKQKGKTLPFELPVKAIVPDAEEDVKLSAMAANANILLLATEPGQLVVLDGETAVARKALPMTGVTGLALNEKGECIGIVNSKISSIDLNTGKTVAWKTAGLAKPMGLAFDRDGNAVTYDGGNDMQVKAYSRDGKLAYTCGQKGGRPLRGHYEKQGLRQISSIAVDAKGQVWTVEASDNPRRVAVWGRDGKLIKDYIGNTAYAGTGSYLNENEADYAYIGSLRMKLNRKDRTWELTDILWVPRPEKNEAFGLWSHAHHFSNPGFVTSSSSGQEKTYIYHNGMYSKYHAVYMERNGCWQPVTAVCYLNELKEQLPQLDLPKGDKNAIVVWNDTNQDGAVQKDEIKICSKKINLGAGWGHSAGKDLSIYTRGLTRFKPVGFTKDGAPIYGEDGIVQYSRKQSGHFAPVDDEKLLLCSGTNKYPQACKILGMDIDTGDVKWTYPNPYPGVHGSHRAPMPKPGMVIGTLKVCGVANLGGEAGSVFMMRGNLGQDFYITTDGLFVGAMFNDGRLPGASLPAKEADLVGQPLDAFTHGSEPFQGWFGKQSDGVVRMLCGLPRQAVMMAKITGLESIRRTKPSELSLSNADLAKADKFNAKQKAANEGPKEYLVKAIKDNPIKSAKAWNGVKAIKVSRDGSGESAEFKLASDGKYLYWHSQVTDQTPWKNLGKNFTRLFKTGDCVDLHLSVTGNKNEAPKAGDMRIVVGPYNGKPVAVLMQAVPFGPVKGQSVTYRTGWSRTVKNVGLLDKATVRVKARGNRYTVDVAIPLADLGIKKLHGKTIRGDVGFISGDAAGRINTARTYWANKETNLVSDEPMEAWLYPAKWGTIKFE